ncbi:MAG: undecaprenyl-diphosphate phosphatase [Pseudomonadales bacterium]|nr:undecaprenyl-diphosphate phosphatase [Pseudomonadales bacterium]
MTYFEAIVLGIVQGLTEFLPVSSSGHLELGKVLLGDTSLPQESMMFTIVVHLATALSTLVVFRADVLQITKGLFSDLRGPEWQFSLKIVLSMIPAALVGVLFSKELELLFDRQILLVGAMLWLTGILLFIADRAQNTERDVTYGNAFVIGLAQAIAILPGISRSGATISTSVILGIDRTRAAKFSFLMVVPLIFGKIAKDLIDGGFHVESGEMTVLAAGFIAAFVTGVVACQWMIALVRRAQLRYFSYYCFTVGGLAGGYALFVQ